MACFGLRKHASQQGTPKATSTLARECHATFNEKLAKEINEFSRTGQTMAEGDRVNGVNKV